MEQIHKKAAVRSPERAVKGISRISVVVPVYNEAAVIPTFTYMLSQVQVPAGLDNFHLVFSNDGSRDASQEVGQQASVPKFTNHVYDSAENHGIGQARILGIREAIRLRKEAGEDPKQHLIITTDIDTRLDSEYFRSLVASYNSNPLLKYSIGPNVFEFSRKLFGISRNLHMPQWVEHGAQNLSLRQRFRHNNRRLHDYINKPYSLGIGPNMAFREDGYMDYDTKRSIQEDTLRSLVQRRVLTKKETAFIPGQRVVTSGRAFESEDKRLSVSFVKYVAKLAKEEAQPYMVANDTSRNVVGEFIAMTDARVYGLSDTERVVSRKPFGRRKADRLRRIGADIRPARSIKTEQLLPNKFIQVS